MQLMNFDSQQLLLWHNLLQLVAKINNNSEQSFFTKIKFWLQKESKNNKSFYIYGSPGCGKTMIMQAFYQQIILPKQYHHFHAFMQKIHSNLHQIRISQQSNNKSQEINLALQKIVGNSQIICFDEFQIVDIADAMLLNKIFSYFFAKNIVVIITANFHPLELYQNGLQRQLYLDFVQEIFLPNCVCYQLSSSIDYRKLKLGLKKHYFISNAKNRLKFQQIFAETIQNKTLQVKNINVWQRNIAIKNTYENIAFFSFKQLCYQNFSADDYRAICCGFDLIFLKTVPYFFEEDINVIRRFSLFIDEVYENKTAIIILAKTIPKKLCKIPIVPQYFDRTISRLQEICSKQYWQESKYVAFNTKSHL
jgi:cell division protein ZapE